MFGIWYYGKTPQRAIKDVALFHTMFLEILPKSPDPGADLRALGLDPRLARYSGMNAYLPEAPIDDPVFRAAFYDRFHVRDVVLFYVERPARLFERVREGAQQAFMPRLPRFLADGAGRARRLVAKRSPPPLPPIRIEERHQPRAHQRAAGPEHLSVHSVHVSPPR